MNTSFADTWYIYIIVIAIVIVMMILCGIYIFRKKYHYIFNRYRSNPDGGIREEDIRVIFLGLLCAEENQCYCDTLSTGLKEKNLDAILSEHWGVIDRETALSQLDWLQTTGDRATYSEIFPYLFIEEGEIEYVTKMEKEVAFMELGKINEKAERLALLIRCVKEMRAHIVFPFNYNNLKRGIVSWDAARLVVLARMSFDKGYLTKQQAWNFMYAAYDMVHLSYDNWREIAIGYVIGHFMDNRGDLESMDRILDLAEDALTNRKSPWIDLKFK